MPRLASNSMFIADIPTASTASAGRLIVSVSFLVLRTKRCRYWMRRRGSISLRTGVTAAQSVRSPGGTRIASGSWDKTVQVWDATTGKVAYIYDGYNVQAARTNDTVGVLPDLIFVVAWSHNGKRIAAVTQVYCGDNCGVVVTWDADTERNVKFYIDTPVFALAWSPDDTRFVTSTDVTTQGTGPNANESDPEAGSYVQI